MEQTDDSLDPVLINTFLVTNKRCRVYFKRNVLMWEVEPTQERSTVPITDVIAAEYLHGKDCNCRLTDSNIQPFHEDAVSLNHTSLIVHYAVSRPENKWRLQEVTFQHADPRQITSWLKTLRNSLRQQQEKRPKRLLVFVNPFCGKRRGEEIYKKTVETILELAGIEREVIVTQHGLHSREVIMSKDLTKYDGVMTVGGDGTVSEVINALVLRRLQDAGADENNMETDIPAVDIPVAIIPGGSTDTIAYCLNGTLDRKTATIYAVLGDQFGLDVCGVYSSRGLCRYFLSLLGYGFLGDVLKESEKHRWMGPKRYDYSGFLKVLKNRRYYLEVDMKLSDRPPATGPKCFKNCQVCGSSVGDVKTRYQEKTLRTIKNGLKLDEPERPTRSLTVRGKYFLVGCANISCACKRSPNGFAPHSHLGDGTMDVLLLNPRSVFDILKLLLKSGSKDQNAALSDLSFSEIYKVREVSVRVLDKDLQVVERAKEGLRLQGSSIWNCDGEIVPDSNVRIKNYRQLVRTFTRRQTPAAPSSGLLSCLACYCGEKNEAKVT